MTIPQRNQSELIELLAQNGWKEISNKDWETHKRIIIGKGAEYFVLQLLPVYNYHFIVKLFESIEIPVPEDCIEFYNQLKELKLRKKDKEAEKSSDEDE